MPQLGPAEILVILLVALVVFGPQRLPSMMRQAGRGLAELRRFQDEMRDELQRALHDEDEAAAADGAPAPTLPPAPERATGARGAPGPAPQPSPGVRAPSRFRAPAPQQPGRSDTPPDAAAGPPGARA